MYSGRNQDGSSTEIIRAVGTRRMTRLTNAFSKKWKNLKAAYVLWFAFYNFCRVHRSIRMTPAMEAGITDHVWEIPDLLYGLQPF
ncbi:MAG: hypothetical protein A3H27_16885 [Acidobacteria bacterium RIFCSPLOWO2_02_FULL_59_13]|nr:MAG: hypothetical protein A3H27_16885 [Acidobacteria bacterium RIFCSPLOWO2_02_FULL_59_13]